MTILIPWDGAIGKVFKGSSRTCEVNDIFGISERFFHIGFDTDAGGFPQKKTGIVPDTWCIGDIERTGQNGVVRRARRLRSTCGPYGHWLLQLLFSFCSLDISDQFIIR